MIPREVQICGKREEKRKRKEVRVRKMSLQVQNLTVISKIQDTNHLSEGLSLHCFEMGEVGEDWCLTLHYIY